MKASKAIALVPLAVLALANTRAESAVTSKVSARQALEIGSNALTAINSGDYKAYSRDWSAKMKAAIREREFLSWRDTVLRTAGKYQKIEKQELVAAKTPGFVKWVFTATFEKGSFLYNLSFPAEGNKVEGAFLEPAPQKAGQ
ncbi:MAG TPA: DUF3887 domain-containing protein [Deinococcales bacterium]|nr:DUF3887 domain-containing protein [Deinococcales bacterium]